MKYPYFLISTLSLQVGLTALIAISSSCIFVVPKVNAGVNSSVIALDPVPATVIYVNPITGVDSDKAGTTTAPCKTITFALSQATSGITIQLAPGTYSNDSGENFPLVLKPGITLHGNESTKGEGILVNGGGSYTSRTFATQNISIFADNETAIAGVTVTNPNTRGTGVWVESTNPTIQNSTFVNSRREGIFVTGTGNPKVINNVFTKNEGNGISIAKSAEGEIRNNLFQDTGFGLAIGGNSKPLIVENEVTQNEDGLFISEAAKPVLRKNVIKNNKRDGIVVTIEAVPDLGTNENPGQNTIRENSRYDLNDSTENHKIASIGNDIGQQHSSAKN